jgi:hypothetical protein
MFKIIRRIEMSNEDTLSIEQKRTREAANYLWLIKEQKKAFSKIHKPQAWYAMEYAPALLDMLIFEHNGDGFACTIGHKLTDGEYYHSHTDFRSEKIIKRPIMWQPIFEPNDPVYEEKYFQTRTLTYEEVAEMGKKEQCFESER